MATTACICTEFLRQNNVSAMQWPAKSPNLNPIENVRGLLKDKVDMVDNPPTIIPELARVPQKELQAIPKADLRHLFISLRWTYTTCTNANGGHIPYY